MHTYNYTVKHFVGIVRPLKMNQFIQFLYIYSLYIYIPVLVIYLFSINCCILFNVHSPASFHPLAYSILLLITSCRSLFPFYHLVKYHCFFCYFPQEALFLCTVPYQLLFTCFIIQFVHFKIELYVCISPQSFHQRLVRWVLGSLHQYLASTSSCAFSFNSSLISWPFLFMLWMSCEIVPKVNTYQCCLLSCWF